ncbi:hypothetical protein DdX_17027 [Ditylenchus destructor]|uniref:F-box domain-containing protein n=1 Tax=Ditylenchus destructor TaxID=166010 RepID=A0AAD4QZD7_9BILA|nr:hypothetical protein DdX_17027 [Ditylenchus destructor]
MRRSRMAWKQAALKNETQTESEAKKCRTDKRNSKIDALGNETMVELFKFLNYSGLAQSSLVSKKFRDVIQIHRPSLQRLYVDYIEIRNTDKEPSPVQMNDQEVSSEAYNEWVISNGYSKKIPFEDQTVGQEGTQNERKVYELSAYAEVEADEVGIRVAHACVEFNNENWPLFQHFLRLIADPNIYIRNMTLVPHMDFLNLLGAAINPANPNRHRLECEELCFVLDGDVQGMMNWVKKYILCDEFQISGKMNVHPQPSNFDPELLEFFLTSANCTTVITLTHYTLSRAIVDLVQKFLDLKNRDEFQLMECIDGEISYRSIGEMTRTYAKYIVKDEEEGDEADGDIKKHMFEFVNNDIGKKLMAQTHFQNAQTYDTAPLHRAGEYETGP